MARVTGIGGVFLKSADPKALGVWYAKHLGVEVGDHGATLDCDGNRVELWQPLDAP
jgi:hypothetical protein